MAKRNYNRNLSTNLKLFLISCFVDLTIKINKILAQKYTELWPSLQLAWFDHRFDYARGPENYYWLERAVYAMKIIKPGDKVLDIGCGDGMLDGLFYSQLSEKVDAVDVDPKAILFAKNKYFRNNIYFYNTDAISWLSKENKYDRIIMFVVIYHFNLETGQKILELVKKSLKKDGTFCGSIPILKFKKSYTSAYKNIFTSEKELKIFLGKVFNKVTVFTTQWPEGRKECYFECSK